MLRSYSRHQETGVIKQVFLPVPWYLFPDTWNSSLETEINN